MIISITHAIAGVVEFKGLLIHINRIEQGGIHRSASRDDEALGECQETIDHLHYQVEEDRWCQ